MGDRTAPIKLIALLLAFASCVLALDTTEPASGDADVGTGTVDLARYEDEFSSLQVKAALIASKPAIALLFEGTDDLHYYAKPETAPAPGFELKAKAESDSFDFGPAVFPGIRRLYPNDPEGCGVNRDHRRRSNRLRDCVHLCGLPHAF